MYLFHFIQVAWNGTLSKRFHVVNGVRQGAILIPILFCVYFDILLDNLDSSGIGCLAVILVLFSSALLLTPTT